MAAKPSVTIDPDLYVLFIDVVRYRLGHKHGAIHEAVAEAVKMYIEKYQPKPEK